MPVALVLNPTVDQVNSPNQAAVVGEREGVMIHFDDSSQDGWAIAWFRDKRCKVSYNRLYLDDGDIVSIVPMHRRAYHAGLCKGGNANSRYYGLSAATNTKTPVTQQQFNSMVSDVVKIFNGHGWKKADVERRIVGHDEVAVYGPEHTKNRRLWGKLGRKIDPTGYDKTRPVINMDGFRAAVALNLAA